MTIDRFNPAVRQPDVDAQEAIVADVFYRPPQDGIHGIMAGFEVNTGVHSIFAGNRVYAIAEVRIYFEVF